MVGLAKNLWAYSSLFTKKPTEVRAIVELELIGYLVDAELGLYKLSFCLERKAFVNNFAG
jgi:hypothetical protein